MMSKGKGEDDRAEVAKKDGEKRRKIEKRATMGGRCRGEVEVVKEEKL
jgi:hypothetical protein